MAVKFRSSVVVDKRFTRYVVEKPFNFLLRIIGRDAPRLKEKR